MSTMSTYRHSRFWAAVILPLFLFAGEARGDECSRIAVGEGYTPISTVQDLWMINDHEYGSFVLTNDIDLNNQNFIPFNQFSGSLLGCNHSIRNVAINLPNGDYVGLFSKLVSAQVKDLKIENIDVHGRDSVGGLAGTALADDQAVRIENVSVLNARIRGRQSVGGLFGETLDLATRTLSFHGKLSQISPPPPVSSSGGRFGGIVGNMLGGSIERARTEGLIQARNNVGGIAGMSSYAATIRQSLSKIDLIGLTRTMFGDGWSWVEKASAIGGIVGTAFAPSFVQESLSLGEISLDSIHYGAIPQYPLSIQAGASGIGGILGVHETYDAQRVEISDSASFVSIQNRGILGRVADSGGLVGGSMSGTSRISVARVFYAGPLSNIKRFQPVVGSQPNTNPAYFTLTESYFDIDTTGVESCPYGAIGLTTEEMQSAESFSSWVTYGWKVREGAYPERPEFAQ